VLHGELLSVGDVSDTPLPCVPDEMTQQLTINEPIFHVPPETACPKKLRIESKRTRVQEHDDEVAGPSSSKRRKLKREMKIDSLRHCTCGCGTITASFQLCQGSNFLGKCLFGNIISDECIRQKSWVCCMSCNNNKSTRKEIKSKGKA